MAMFKELMDVGKVLAPWMQPGKTKEAEITTRKRQDGPGGSRADPIRCKLLLFNPHRE
jgi:hypothetical protein